MHDIVAMEQIHWVVELSDWARNQIPVLNERAFEGSLSSGAMAGFFNDAMKRMPLPDEIHDRDVMKVLMILGVCGSSIERTAQQEDRRAGIDIEAGRGIGMLVVGGGHQFADYFAQVANRIGHMHRDSFVTYVECNGPEVRIRHPRTGEVIHHLHAAFDDGAYIVFTGCSEELEFLHLLKNTAGLQAAANVCLERLQHLPLDHPEAVQACLDATHLILAVRTRFMEFIRTSSFNADFYLDILRQYFCLWSSRKFMRPPSGANDDSILLRDVTLFTELLPAHDRFPGYTQYVRHVFHALMPEAVQRLETSLEHDSIDARLSQMLATPVEALRQLTSEDATLMLSANPWIAAYAALYDAQRDASRAHHGAVTLYLTTPKKSRDSQNDPREHVTVVPNTHGTTGMDPMGILRQLNDARSNHPLTAFSIRARQAVTMQLESFGYRPLSHAKLMTLSGE